MTEKPQFWLRPLALPDIETVATFEREIAKVSFPDDPITDLKFYMKKVGRLVGDPNVAAIVAESEAGVVGWAYVSKRQNFITKEPYGDFHSIYISPSQRGTGAASELVQAIFDFCQKEKLDRVVFRTRATNERMKAVLARFGFVPTQIFYEKALAIDDRVSADKPAR
ncbi:MAG: GNAT family N-acetyltransferase [Hyphomicrobiales bacterium]|nr:GNAT family N-acetyltransferase [Hyphomicrobiales bacterium]